MDDLETAVNEVSMLVKQASLFLRDSIKTFGEDKNPSTNVDILISDFLSDSLRRVVDVDVLSEESASSFNWTSERIWLIDPIDGTMNFIAGAPDVAISVALVDKNFNAVLSVIYLPFYDEVYTAIKNRGAYLNEKPINHEHPKLDIVAYGLPADASVRLDQIAKAITILIRNGYILRQSGSAALDICRVAKCTWKAFFEDGLYVWDVAAANLIALESGCSTFIALSGDSYQCNYISCNTETLLDEMKRLLG
ncbi:inositol monophosphatase family protein [Azonexus sp.]|uniref:inositol monophosphatase family protein n=1 Tax=Azonexus sp. TaxID=1872668 RepID=UPI0035B08EA9